MSYLIADVTSNWGERLGWMLVHSVWEIGLVAIVYAMALTMTQRSASTVRYAAGFIALICMLVALPVTFVFIEGSSMSLRESLIPPTNLNISVAPSNSFAPIVVPHINADPASSVKVSATDPWQTRIAPILPWLTAVWFAGVILFSLRLLVGLAAVERMRRVGLEHVDAQIATIGESLASRLGLRRAVKLANSALVQVPTVIGYLRPMVLLPAVPLTGLSTREIEFLLAHELAHIRRHDYLQNLIQGVIETLLFYHPAMWWVSSRVRRERENCCDDLVVATLENRSEYARTLFSLEQRRSIFSPGLAASDGPLLERIRRLLASPARATVGPQWGKGLAGLAVLSLLMSIPLAIAVRNSAAEPAGDTSAEHRDPVTSVESSPNTNPLVIDRQSKPAKFVRILVASNNKITFEGQETTWDTCAALLEKVPDRASTVLEVAIASDDITVRAMNDAIGRASALGRQLGFQYTSYIGVHPPDVKSRVEELLKRDPHWGLLTQQLAAALLQMEDSSGRRRAQSNIDKQVEYIKRQAEQYKAEFTKKVLRDTQNKPKDNDTGPFPQHSNSTEGPTAQQPIIAGRHEPTPAQSKRLIFKPEADTAQRTNWTSLGKWENSKPYVRMMAHVALGGEFPVTAPDDLKPLFKVRLVSGDDNSIVVKISPPSGPVSLVTLVRGKDPTPVKLSGKTYLILYPDTYVNLDEPSETPLALITVTYQLNDSSDGSGVHSHTSDPSKSSSNGISAGGPPPHSGMHVVRFEQGATRFANGDEIKIDKVLGTAETFEPGNIYQIRGTYKLSSRDKAILLASTTATDEAEIMTMMQLYPNMRTDFVQPGKSPGTVPGHATGIELKVQRADIVRGAGEFTLFLPMTYKGLPHVSFYSTDKGEGFGATYFGTGDTVLKKWWNEK
jgi:beta-lactamase regulating signal transducer with metallopeptidase domain